jgi:hypothetical protein
MYDALGLLVDFFHANEKGLEMKKIASDQFIVSIKLDIFHHKKGSCWKKMKNVIADFLHVEY